MFTALFLALSALAATEPEPTLQYTTYFYTAGEAIIHGYEPKTKVRIVSMEKKGTVWEGTVGVGETQMVRTGMGVFGFISDKKATILVGTPSSCTVVGYFLKDENGSFRSRRFFGSLPEGADPGRHFVIWAYEAADVELLLQGSKEPFATASLPAGGHLDITGPELARIAGRTIEVRSKGASVAAQVYYDEGFMVPSENGTGSGRRFLTYVGTLTNQVNDLNLIAQGADADVTVRDVRTGELLFHGEVPKGTIRPLTLAGKFVEVRSTVPINAVVAAFEHYQAGYAEHHFQTGLEGSGIENDFLVTTSGELWLFSYFVDNAVTVADARTGKEVFKGTLGAGAVRGLKPGFGLFRVKASKGLSVMGGASSCGADYSPAGSMFAVDEALFDVLAQIQTERVTQAAASGRKLTEAELNAPLSNDEWQRHSSQVNRAAKRGLRLDEVNERAAAVRHR